MSATLATTLATTTPVAALVSTALAGLGVAVAVGGGRRRPPAWLAPAGTRDPVPPASAGAADPAGAEESWLRRLRVPLAALGLLGAWVLVGGVAGLLVGGVVAAVSAVVLGRAESPALRRRAERLARELPTAVDLVAACLVAGAAPETALGVVAEALDGPVAEELWLVHHRLALGMDPAGVWGRLAEHEQLGPLGRAVERAHESGASVAEAVSRLGPELRAQERAAVHERARSVEVRSAAPLGVCFMPAFVLLGVVPLVVEIFSSMHLFS